MYKINGIPSAQLPEYGIWHQMRNRCNNPKNPAYHNYGGRGINVCDSWNESFSNFHADMGLRPSPELTLDRIDNDGDYCKDNCRWTDRVTQGNNSRASVLVTHNGMTMNLKQWAKYAGIPYKAFHNRINGYNGYKWSFEKAISVPVRKRK